MNQITHITAAIRMKACHGAMVAARFLESSEVDSKNSAIKAGWPSIHVTEIEPDITTEELKALKLPDPCNLVAVKHEGYIITASSASNIEEIQKTNTFKENHQFPVGRMKGKTAIITGAAQGFGQGIAESFFEEGANVVIADLNEEKGQRLVKELNDTQRANRALFIKCNVAEAPSVEYMVEKTVLHFGGIDTFISNAGILMAGGLDEMEPDIFERMTKVNYNGFFHCVKAGSAIMKIQTAMKPDYFADIIQINSKSGLKGSNKNFAYAGAKFGGIGLTQSFALELMPHHIKVNAVCPGNFFEGPLWSDPEKGLFVQYLNAGKVPEAKSIEDIKKHYETQVPAGRGCRVKDVVKALFYAIDQEYETGQAIPVTGGQNMLS
ncbi:SDR family NAD(P)-dependent oxidoreductase [Marinilabilia salmonicolor]|uniref:Sorbitol-6-phosphate 2-dehydrogenase n=1 Tax=Marinilabilia salmonicolor TaxID=989 RepID=A0A368UWU4_9BACT|nr:SDR family NAD(P)-dependent oxidoreductase [Marinilabilia salmonicolor]RCW32530.1 sorbitol-6-phosphate 2-dehydrogenase [Marinilabilia salmonicolor]